MIVGTTLGCLVHLDELVTSGEPAGFSVATGKPGRWLRAMPVMVGAAWLGSPTPRPLPVDAEGRADRRHRRYPRRRGGQKPYVGSGVGLYDAMATMSRRTGGAPHARYLGRRAVQRAAPGLDPEVVIAGLQYPDGRMDDARHTLAVAQRHTGRT